MTLKISNTLSLPIDFVTLTQAILAKKGSGKSYTASVQAEELLEAGQQIVVIDPTGAWYGLRSSADGKTSGYPIAVLGGEHGDVPLEPTAGEVIAAAIAAEHFSAIIDLSLFRKGESLRFMAAFLETLYRKNRDALHLFIDEADVVAPQKPYGEESKVLGATEDIVRRGRIRGIGCTLITQRPQVLNKNVLSQVDMLTTLRMNHPKDLGAIDEWVAVHADTTQAKKMMGSLPSLPIGDAWLWAPAHDLFERVTIRRRTTFDSGRTPKAGERAVAPKVLAQVDLTRLGAAIIATVERTKQDDPKALRARIAELEKGMRPAEPRVIEKLVITESQLRRLESAIQEATLLRERIDILTGELGDASDQVGIALVDIKAAIELNGHAPVGQRDPKPPNGTHRGGMRFEELDMPTQRAVERSLQRPTPRGSGPGDASLGGGERKILTALAQYPQGRTKQQVAILTEYAHNGGGFNNYVSALRGKGYLEGDAEALRITSDGAAALGAYDPLPSGRALFEHWHRKLGKAERAVLEVLFEEWPNARPKEYVATKAGYAADGGGFNNALSRLRTLELIEGKAKLKASDQLQDGAQ